MKYILLVEMELENDLVAATAATNMAKSSGKDIGIFKEGEYRYSVSPQTDFFQEPLTGRIQIGS